MRSFPNVMCYVCLAVFVLTPGAAFAQGGSGGLITKQWVGPSDSGQIGIQMIAPPNVPGIPAEAPISVMLAGLDGTVYTADASAESAGGLSLDNLPPGVYTMLARGPGLVACYAIHVVPPPDGGFAESGQVLEIVPAALPPAGVRSAIIRYTPPSVDVPVQMDYDEGEAFVAGQASASNLHRVLQSDGGIKGRIYQAGTRMIGSPLTNVMIFAGAEQVAQAVTEEDGSFTIETLPQGSYSVIAVGPSGIGITAMEVVNEVLPAADTVRADPGTSGRLVAVQAPAFQPQFQLQLAPAGLESPLIRELVQVDPSEDSVPEIDPEMALGGAAGNAPMSGGFGGGGGGGGLGGGGLGLLGLAGAGIGVAALAADDDEDAIDTPPVVSPISPATNSVPPVVIQQFAPNVGN